MKTYKITLAIMGLVLIAVGIYLIGESSDYWLAFGVFLMIWSNNISNHLQQMKNKSNGKGS